MKQNPVLDPLLGVPGPPFEQILRKYLLQQDGSERVTGEFQRVCLFACPAGMKIAFSPSSDFFSVKIQRRKRERKKKLGQRRMSDWTKF